MIGKSHCFGFTSRQRCLIVISILPRKTFIKMHVFIALTFRGRFRKYWCFFVVAGRPRGRRLVSIGCFWQGLDTGCKKEQVKKNNYIHFLVLSRQINTKGHNFFTYTFSNTISNTTQSVHLGGTYGTYELLVYWFVWAKRENCYNKCQNLIMTGYQFVSSCHYRSWR